MELAVHSDDPARFSPGSVVLLAGEERALTVRSARSARGRTIVSFHEVPDRTGAEAMRGRDLEIPSEALRELADGEYWDHELISCRVETVTGLPVGTVADVMHLPANDVLVVDGEREHLIPLVAHVVVSVDVAARIVRIDPIPGLLDDDVTSADTPE